MRFVFTAMVFALLVMGLLLPQSVLAWGEIRVVTNNLNVRGARRADAPKIMTLSKGQKIKVDFIKGKWGALFPLDAAVRDKSKAIGYANVQHLKFVANAPEVSLGNELKIVAVKPEPMDISTAESQPTQPTQSVEPNPAKPKPAEAKPVPAAIKPSSTTVDNEHVVSRSQGAVVARVQEHVDQVEAQGAEKPPVKITADRMVYNEIKRTVVFEGSVRAEHLDLELFSKTLTAYFSKGSKGKGADQIERIVAKGKVLVNRKTTEGRCDTLTYLVQQGILRMEGNPVLQDGDNIISGQVIKFYLKDNRSEVVGGKGKRVQAVFSAPGGLEP